MAGRSVPPMIIMGVQGSGKSTIGSLLARRLDVPFIDGDRLHSKENRAWMAAGHPLSDEQRLPWLREVGACLAKGAGTGVVAACSALKRSYRDLLREQAPSMLTVFASGDADLIHSRLIARSHEYMPASLLTAQLDDLEARQDDEPGLTVDIAKSPEDVVDCIMTMLSERDTGSRRP
jgi:gluconokinase